MGRLDDTGIGEVVKGILSGKHDVYSVTRVGVDIQSIHTDEYLGALQNLMKESGIPFGSHEFMERAVHMHEWMRNDQIYIIGAQKSARKHTIEYQTEKLVDFVEKCPGGDVLKRAKADYHFPLNKTFDNRPSFNDFVKGAKKKDLHVLTIAHGPKYFTRDELKDVSELFLAPILRGRR